MGRYRRYTTQNYAIMRILYCIILIAFSYYLASCSDNNAVTLALDMEIKDRAAHPKLLRMISPSKPKNSTSRNPFVTPVIKVDQDNYSRTDVKYLPVKGAIYNTGKVLLNIVVTDNNNNGKFDDGDAVDFSGYGEDSVYLTNSPLKVIGKSPVYLKYDQSVLQVNIDSHIKEITIIEKPGFEYFDLAFPTSVPEYQVENMQTKEQLNLTELRNTNTPFLLIRSAPYCKPCFQTFQKYVDRFNTLSKEAKSTTKVFFFPKETDITNIVKYTEYISDKHNFLFVKGDLEVFENTYGLHGLPDGVLFDNNGNFYKNHFLLSNFK